MFDWTVEITGKIAQKNSSRGLPVVIALPQR